MLIGMAMQDPNHPTAAPWQPPDPAGGQHSERPGSQPPYSAAPSPYGAPYPPQRSPGGPLPSPLAATGDRFVQGLIDHLVTLIPYVVLLSVGGVLLGVGVYNRSVGMLLGGIAVFVAAIVVYFGVTFYTEAWRPAKRSDQTYGMQRKRLRIVKLDGSPMRLSDHTLRWLLYVLIDSGWLALLLIALTERKQRLGDMAARTVVVELPHE